MPKRPGDISKTKRVQTLLELFESYGRMDKDEIDRLMAEKLGLDKQTLKRSLYRDLEDLVQDNRLKEFFYQRDGAAIDFYDSEIHKSVKKQWGLIQVETSIKGEKLLRDLGGQIICDHPCRKYFSIQHVQNLPLLETEVYMLFSLGVQVLCLSVPKDQLPLKIHFSRQTGQQSSDELKELKTEFGSRLLIFKLPFREISAHRVQEQLGHGLVHLQDKEIIELKDLNSSNGVYATEIDPSELQKVISWSHNLGPKTSNLTLSNNSIISTTLKKIKKTQSYQSPILARMGESFSFVIFHP